MAKELTAISVKKNSKPGLYRDGKTVGLYLQVTSKNAKSWLYRFMLDGKARAMGLGSAMPGQVSLSEARQMAQDARRLLRKGVDPIQSRSQIVGAARLDAARSITFQQAAERYIEAHKGGWSNAKHLYQWETTLKMFVYPLIGTVSATAVTTEHVMQVLQPIWHDKRETASRLRGRIEKVLDWARVMGFRTGENPARWRDHLSHLLGNQKKAVRHHPSLPYANISKFYAALRDQSGAAAAALEFTILTAARTGETIGMRFPEIDWTEKVWTIPAERMKAKRPHRVPLADRAMTILQTMKDARVSDFVFPGGKAGRPLSNMAMAKLVDRMGDWLDDKGQPITVHGFRSTFRDWTAHETAFPREIAELALAHVIADETEQAYQRGDLLNKRRLLMASWAQFCSEPRAGNVVVLHA